MSINRLDTIRNKSRLWRWFDKYGRVFDSINQDKGPSGQCMHDRCTLALMTEKKPNLTIKIRIHKKKKRT